MTSMQRIGGAVCALLLTGISAVTLWAQTLEQHDIQRKSIKVHGHWTIDIKHANGALDTHHEFQNALTAVGNLTLVNIVSRQRSPGSWSVELLGTAQSIGMLEGPGAGDFTVSVPTSGPNLGKLVLAGSVTSPVAQSFTRVFTRVYSCPPGTNCLPSSNPTFTFKDFAPIAVQAGQIVQVTVVISFS